MAVKDKQPTHGCHFYSKSIKIIIGPSKDGMIDVKDCLISSHMSHFDRKNWL